MLIEAAEVFSTQLIDVSGKKNQVKKVRKFERQHDTCVYAYFKRLPFNNKT